MPTLKMFAMFVSAMLLTVTGVILTAVSVFSIKLLIVSLPLMICGIVLLFFFVALYQQIMPRALWHDMTLDKKNLGAAVLVAAIVLIIVMAMLAGVAWLSLSLHLLLSYSLAVVASLGVIIWFRLVESLINWLYLWSDTVTLKQFMLSSVTYQGEGILTLLKKVAKGKRG
jgi:hypothetical protein